MECYYVKGKNIQKNVNQVLVMVKQLYCQNVQYVVAKNQDLLKIKNQKDY